MTVRASRPWSNGSGARGAEPVGEGHNRIYFQIRPNFVMKRLRNTSGNATSRPNASVGLSQIQTYTFVLIC
ncbi:unnamed protein product [Menidia menidia]|uniref:(Atlantic silverside) hypothetical protein n=1 Tax=Menidia menidia TaxID=238744 RepID=A0A8S4AYK9_9TELE|nr:unnamed protein product [Menidia menidia]